MQLPTGQLNCLFPALSPLPDAAGQLLWSLKGIRSQGFIWGPSQAMPSGLEPPPQTGDLRGDSIELFLSPATQP